MKFLISQPSFVAALSLAQRTISTKQALPILEMVKITAQKKSVTIEATDLTIGVTITLLTKTIEEGCCVVPLKSFFAQLNTLTQEELEIKVAGSNIEVIAKTTRLSFSVGDVNDFPELPQIKGQKWVLPKVVLNKACVLVLPSVAKDQVRPILSSVLFIQNDEGTEVVATDGIRLSVYKHQIGKMPISQILLPGRAVVEMNKILESGDSDEVEMIISEEQQILNTQIGNIRIFSKLVAGEYPPYQKIIPNSFQTTLKLDRAELEENVNRSILTGGKESGYFQLVIGTDKTTFYTKNRSGESIESVILTRDLVGSSVEIAFNSRLVLDMLRSVSDQEVKLSIGDPLRPAVFSAESEPGFKFVIMPFKVNV